MKQVVLIWNLACCLLALWVTGCASVERKEPVTRPALPPIEPEPRSSLYSAEQALRDVLSSELEYVGTGRWHGIERGYACAFRNERVLVVNAYCTLTEVPAFSVDVYSPDRGHVSIYAEANGGVSTHDRRDYFTFRVSSAPAPVSTRVSPVSLSMSYEQLELHERERYDANLPSCFGGEQRQQMQGACLGTLDSEYGDWNAQNGAFLQHASQDWYSVVRTLRTLATRYGREPSSR